MIEFDDHYQARKVEKAKYKNISHSQIVNEKLLSWQDFQNATNQAVGIISEQSSLYDAYIKALEWYESCIKLGKLFYAVDEVDNRIYNRTKILESNILNLDFVGMNRTFLTVFTDVAKYGVKKDVV